MEDLEFEKMLRDFTIFFRDHPRENKTDDEIAQEFFISRDLGKYEK